MIKPRYSIVIYSIPKYDIDFKKESSEEIKTKIKNSDYKQIKVERVMA